MNRDFKGIWIPKEIWLNKSLTLQEKVFLVEIDSLDNENGCFASNEYFSNFFSLSKNRVSLIIKSLAEKQFITHHILYKEGSKQIEKRVLKVCNIPYLSKHKDPITQNAKDNNTVSNTINNTVIKSKDFSIEILSLYEELILLFPSHIRPTTEIKKNTWLDTIEKLERIDKIPLNYIYDITKKVRNDDFWSSNFLSLTKLRKKNKDGLKYIQVFHEKFGKPKKDRQQQQVELLQENLKGWENIEINN